MRNYLFVLLFQLDAHKRPSFSESINLSIIIIIIIILDLCDKRRVLNELKKNNSDIKEEYREINISIRKQMKNAKENWIQEQCNAINEDMARGRSNKRAYQILKTLTNPIKKENHYNRRRKTKQ